MTKKLLSLLFVLSISLLGFGQMNQKGTSPAPPVNPAQNGTSFHGVISMDKSKNYPEQHPGPREPLLALTPDNYRLFKGDSLDGFDFDAAFLELNKINNGGRMAEMEKRMFMKHREAHYIQDKYHLTTPLVAERGTPAQRLKEFQEHLVHEINAKKASGTNPHPLSGCNNAGFETGDFTGWSGGYGFNAGARPNGLSLFIKSFTIGSPYGNNQNVSTCQPHTLVSGGTDPYCGLSVLDPSGGGWTARLGGDEYNINYNQLYGCWGGSEASVYTGGLDDPQIAYSPTPPYYMFPPYSYAQTSTTAYTGSTDYSGAEFLEQSFTVDATNALFTYNYLVVLQDGGHPVGDMPYFEVDVFDGSGNPINCLTYYQECTSGSPPTGYSTSGVANPNAPGSPVYYSGWRSNTLDLSGYSGQTITIYFSAAGCSWGGHFGYAYIDGSCGAKQLYVSTPAACLGQTMTVTAPPSPPGTLYSWTGPGIVGSTTGSVITVNANGVYNVTVTPGNGCSYTVSATVAFAMPATITPSQANVNCNGNHNGTATAVASGGNPAYTYNWTGGGYGGGGQGTATATGLAPGTYTCTINTANGCPSSQVYTITQPAALAVSPAQTNLSCNGAGTGSATATPSGGSPGYTYAWTPSGGSGTTASSLAAGTYTCTIHDANSCSTSQTFTITQPAALTDAPSQTNASCNGATGSATVSIGGGTPGYTYTWTPSGGSATTAPGLAAGTYTCTVHDANGCPASHTFTITQPSTLGLSTSGQTNVACNGNNSGSATVTASGGTPGYTYTWAPSGGSGATASTLTAGTYTCTIHDVNNCTTSQTVTITQPASALSQTPTQANVACNGNTNGTASVAIAGGTAGYTYTWAPAPGGGQGTANATGLGAGNYTVTVHDANNCVLTNVFTITAPAVLSTGVSQLN
ncbi:MAG TPA: SprB repeat-containing protein, partial [Bacteroidia bacterium]|nr:SprB repeat-containing protein [Bacteroidia bacterium]